MQLTQLPILPHAADIYPIQLLHSPGVFLMVQFKIIFYYPIATLNKIGNYTTYTSFFVKYYFN